MKHEFDLQLHRITQGVLVCVIREDGTTGIVARVGEFSELHGKYRMESVSTGKHIGLLPTDGLGYYAMHKKDKPHFFYSANPEHVDKARKVIDKAKIHSLQKEQKEKKALTELEAKLNALLSEYSAELNVSVEGDTHGVNTELHLTIGHNVVILK